MHRTNGILTLLLSVMLAIALADGGRAHAQPSEESRRAQVNAATANAAERLRDDVLAARITGGLTVGEFVRQTDSAAVVQNVLDRAQQIGGPRWIDERVCQIQLEVSGQAVADVLMNIASSKPQRLPIRREDLAVALKDWRDRSFSVTGKSSSPYQVEMIRPHRDHDWERVSDEIRTRAIRAAQQDAARRALDSVRGVELAPGMTVADALARPQVTQRMYGWFESRPIKSVVFRENLEVDLTLGAPPEETFDELVRALETSGDVKLDADEPARQRARAAFAQRMTEPAGRATVAREAVQVIPEDVELPPQPPNWINRQIDADGTAQPARDKALARVNAAQERAVQNLRAKVGALPITERLSIEQAARKDPALARAVDRAMLRARLFKVDYGADGSVIVRMTIDAQDVWEELANAR